MKLKYIYILLVVSLFIYGCAQIGTLTGGENDTVPPVFVKGQPENKSVNFKDDKIIIHFDEFFILNNLNNIFLSSPFMTEKPDFIIKRKKLAVKFNESLEDSTTYTLWFGDAIQDYHENNPLKDFKFIFSTGPLLDTFEISGVISDAYNLIGEPDMFVMLYQSYKDSTPIIEKPYYITKTDTSGRFKTDYIKPGKYRIFALNDQDGNFNFNLPNEKIAYIDSFIIPKVKTETQIDSLKAGTILHKAEEDAEGDTLINDTVIFTTKYIYSPGNLKLFAFTEDKQKQYVLNTLREVKGKCLFEFSKPTDSIFIDGLNFNLTKNNSFREKQDSARKVIYWLKDENIFNTDTLEFKVSYYNKDSLENFVKETDTLKFVFDVQADTIKKFVDYIDLKQEQDSFANYCLQTESPINFIDTALLKFFKIYDTLVVDTKKQELLKSIRPAPDTLIFAIKRPYINNFDIEFLNIETSANSYEKHYSENDTLLECKIIENQIIEKDTLKIVVHYDNDFFLGQTQKFTDTIVMPLFKQGLISLKRPAPDTLILNFKKHLTGKTSITLIDNETKAWYNIIEQEKKEELHLHINKKNISDEDTFLVTIRTYDYDNTLGDKIDYEYSKSAIYKRKKQNINSFSRKKRNSFYFVLNKPLEDEISVKLLNHNIENNWFEKELNKTKDTVTFTITQDFISKKDTLKLAVGYNVRFRKNVYEQKSDTINLIYIKFTRSRRKKTKQSEDNKNDTAVNKQNVSIEIPVDFILKNDSVSERKLWVLYPWKTGTEYILKLDSGAVIDFYNNKSIKKEIKFKVRTKDFYSRILLNISNIKRISDKNFYLTNDTSKIDSASYIIKDSLNFDSASYIIEDSLYIDSVSNAAKNKMNADSVSRSKLDEGQLIIYLFDKDKKLVTEKIVTEDGQLIFDNLIPGSYTMKLFYDKNNNSKWDPGDYLKNIQPERVLIYTKGITLISNEDNEIDWKITSP
ncbi:MAG: Ig-like domain-containing protein [Bacteroidales bacterium]|nr:Ig-like domain-containing protein [Bacteroidales bacterium]